MEALNAGAVDGWLLFAVEPPAATSALGPIVLIESQASDHPAVVLDVAAGADAAMRHLLELGHRRIAHLAADIPAWTFRERGLRWELAVGLDRRDLQLVELRARAPFTLQGARAAARRLLAEQRPTAVFCDDDLLAAGAYLAAYDLELRIPIDLSVVGFAGTQPGDVLRPALATVVAPAERLGEVAMSNLLTLLAGRDVEPLTVLDVELRLGGSTAPPEG